MFISCPRHQFAVEYTPEPLKPTPPPDQVCAECRAERSAEPLSERTGTQSATRVVSASTPDDEYLAGVRSPAARRKLIELRDQRQHEHDAAAAALMEMDAKRPLVVAYDHARPGSERRAARRKMLRSARGPRW